MGRYLIVSDMDGTILPYGQKELDQEVFDLITALRERGHYFSVASGRDYTSLKHLFHPVWEDIYFISAHGNQIFYQDKILFESCLPIALAREIASDAANQGLEAVITTSKTSFILSEHLDKLDLLTDYQTNVGHVASFDQLTEDAVKVAVRCPQGVLKIHDYFQDQWGGQVKVAPSADDWIDFTKSDKGDALTFLAENLGVDLADTWAFGDQYNDLPMLNRVGHAYIVQDAYPELKSLGFTETNDVIGVFKSILVNAE